MIFDEFVQRSISTHAPHARRDRRICLILLINAISTHAPHARRDYFLISRPLKGEIFLLTRLMRGATSEPNMVNVGANISTHAPHARRDLYICRFLS